MVGTLYVYQISYSQVYISIYVHNIICEDRVRKIISTLECMQRYNDLKYTRFQLFDRK